MQHPKLLGDRRTIQKQANDCVWVNAEVAHTGMLACLTGLPRLILEYGEVFFQVRFVSPRHGCVNALATMHPPRPTL